MKPYCIPQLAKPYTNYDMIQRHTELPPFSDGRGHLLYIFLNHSSVVQRQNERELYTLVTGLLQLGLDTHEGIDRSNDVRGEDPMRSRQLKVLAGDYFSSWFYHLLAKNNQIEMVGVLSKAIADFNVMKANLYVKMREKFLTAEQYLRYMVQLNMRLFLSFSPMIEKPIVELWEKLLAEFSHCETVIGELLRSKDPSNIRDSYAYWKILEHATADERQLLQSSSLDEKDWKLLVIKSKCDTILQDKLHQSIQSIQEQIKGINDEHLIRELGVLLDRFLRKMENSGQAAAEG